MTPPILGDINNLDVTKFFVFLNSTFSLKKKKQHATNIIKTIHLLNT